MSKKIMFNDLYGLTQAVLDGRKTMTRRIVPEREIEDYQVRIDDFLSIGFGDLPVQVQSFEDAMINRARYSVGEIVAVAQAYKDIDEYNPKSYEDVALDCGVITSSGHPYPSLRKSAGWSNKMFVRADLMKYKIRITNVRVERLQDCSDDDILKEGIFPISAPINRHYNGIGYTFKGWTDRGVECSSDTPKGAFKALIDKTYGCGTFESNPYVFVYSFKLLD